MMSISYFLNDGSSAAPRLSAYLNLENLVDRARHRRSDRLLLARNCSLCAVCFALSSA